jgi:hypothetical protein
VILGQNRGFVRFLVLVSVYAIDWTWFEKEGQVRKGHKKLTITLLNMQEALYAPRNCIERDLHTFPFI